MTFKEALEFINSPSSTELKHNDKIKRWRDVYYGMSLHTTGACPSFANLHKGRSATILPPYYFGSEYQWFFENLLFARHPREHEDTRNWRLSQYKPLTRAPFQQTIDIITGAIFQDSNYQITVEDELDNQYIWDNNFIDYDLIGWFANVGIQNIIEDPNGLILRMPLLPWYEQPAFGKVDVGIWFVNSKDILAYGRDYLIFRRDEHIYFIDTKTIWRYSKDNDGKWDAIGKDADGYYSHMLGRLPVDVAGGVWNSQGFYDSFLMKAKAAADDYISSYSAEQMVDKEASHPFIIIANDECTSCQGVGKVSEVCDDCDSGYDLVDCRSCKGKGTVSMSPSDRIYAPAKDMQNDLVKIVNPDVAINQYHHDKNDDIFDKILHALNLYKTDKAESGEAKAIDQERLYQFISKISNHLFDKLIYNTVSDIIAYRNLGVVNGVLSPINNPFSVQKPTQFQMKTAEQLLGEFKQGKDSGLPAFVRNKMVFDFVDKQYSGDPLMKRKTSLILEMDDLAGYSEDEILTLSTIGTVSKDDIVLSRKLPSYIDTLIRLKGEQWLLDATYEAIEEEVNKLRASDIQTPLFNPNEELLS